MITVLIATLFSAQALIVPQTPVQAGPPKQVAPIPFDPKADPVKDLAAALAKAKKTGKNVVLDVGGEWCIWCHRLDAFISEQPTVKALVDKGFVWMKVNFSPDNKNEAFLASYPKIQGYPHLFVLDAQGKLLHSQDTGLLEEGPGYNLNKVTAFLTKWTPKGK